MSREFAVSLPVGRMLQGETAKVLAPHLDCPGVLVLWAVENALPAAGTLAMGADNNELVGVFHGERF